MVYESRNAGTARHTIATFVVDDIESEVDELRARGVRFEEYDEGELTTHDGIAETDTGRCAWFVDPAGNILSITQHAHAMVH
jgi:predicted enzyme related to lactoylglutathione lyase